MIEIRLSERETQVLQGMCLGHTNAQIGRTIGMSEDTVKTNARRLFTKTRCSGPRQRRLHRRNPRPTASRRATIVTQPGRGRQRTRADRLADPATATGPARLLRPTHRRVLRGERLPLPRIRHVGVPHCQASMTTTTAVLTPADLRIVGMLADGLTVNQAATRLGIKPTTVSTHLNRIAGVLGTNTMTQTAVECDRRGLLGRDTHRARRVRRELADRHTSTCALLQTPVCDCTPDVPSSKEKP